MFRSVLTKNLGCMQTVEWSNNGVNFYRASGAADLKFVSSDCKCARDNSMPTSFRSADGISSIESLPDPGEVLVVCSRFHTGSDRGIMVCPLNEYPGTTSRVWMVTASELQRVPASMQTRTYAKGSLVQLNTSLWESAGKCLGSISDGRYGVIMSSGVRRNGIQRNIEVVLVCKPGPTALWL